MMCEEPYYSTEHETFFPCGKCVPCKIKRKMEWVTRIILEKKCHEKMVYVTLTYNDDNLVYGGSDQPTLYPPHVVNFLKNLRRQLDYHYNGLKIRYFLCGEYGDDVGHRPHYHLVIFGIDETYSHVINKCWPYGFTKILPVKKGCAEYVAGYCVKKYDKLTNFYKEKEVFKEFFRSSLGLGGHIVEEVAEHVVKHNLHDVPRFIMEGKKKLYLTRYWIKKIRLRCFDLQYIENLTSLYLSLGREKFMSDLAPFLPRLLEYYRGFYQRFIFERAYSLCYKHIIRNNMLKYSKLLNTRGRICQSEVNLI